ncbi:MAG: hypothetical protein AAFQ63_15640 [Cyanobacteria bacterium J06621_11]
MELVPTNREKITFVCDADLKKALENWASEESRSVSNLCELIIRRAAEGRSQSAQVHNPESRQHQTSDTT